MSNPEENFEIFIESFKAFDTKAAECATPEQATKCLKVLKHYIRVYLGSKDVNLYLKSYLNCLGIEPEVSGSVVGGYKHALNLLKMDHKCTGKDCVKKYKQQKANGGSFLTRMKETNIKTKASVRQQKKKVPNNAAGSKESKETFLSYFL
ncbi:hypothetical protein AVEN_255438-1 [Araneus ventricosus]|uniref:Uncharacterized protein n=1 Tax=Araneus ventricosus TaxID=182803 RepID=A0A4Y2HP24_ARAVE|nr:hypothetical protein AVEN_255438-1 [Araneus ventricosus]